MKTIEQNTFLENTMKTQGVFYRNTNLVLSKKIHDVFIVTLLGDRSLNSSQKGGAWSSRCLHGASQEEYPFHKYSLFRDWCLTEPNFQKFKN